ncbi:MAG TPA: citrate synthase family protein [Stellaceae bacterium]|nr:citrate synthase family protein [Stellaceae bacterium]
MLSARETAERLGIKLDTLYAYVSRGQLRSIEIAESRERRYDADDVERFRATRGGLRAGRIQAEALVPVIGSAICLIENHRIYYRGEDALRLADTATLEEVAAILWDAPATTEATTEAPTLPRTRGRKNSERGVEAAARLGLIEQCQIRLAIVAPTDLAALDLTQGGVARTGRRILGELAACLAACLGGTGTSRSPIHAQLANAWRLADADADLVRRCLVLLADHELNASTFVARCIASTGATPYAVVTGAIAALSGRKHGGASARAEALFRELGDAADPMPAMAARLARDEDLPGIGQPLYPEGDPRALAIIEALVKARPQAGARVAAAAVAAMQLTGGFPNIDFALGAATTVLGLPPGTALGLFLLARSVGWIAHAIEQYESGVLIRPRARYMGRRPIKE